MAQQVYLKKGPSARARDTQPSADIVLVEPNRQQIISGGGPGPCWRMLLDGRDIGTTRSYSAAVARLNEAVAFEVVA